MPLFCWTLWQMLIAQVPGSVLHLNSCLPRMGYVDHFSLFTLLLDFTRCLAGPSLVHSNCVTSPMTRGTWASQPCVQTDAELCCWSCHYWSERAFFLCWFAVLFWGFANAVPFLSSQGILLHLCKTASVSNFQLWVGSVFCLQSPHGKTDEGSSCVSIFLLFLNMWRIDFLHILIQLSILSFFSLVPFLTE